MTVSKFKYLALLGISSSLSFGCCSSLHSNVICKTLDEAKYKWRVIITFQTLAFLYFVGLFILIVIFKSLFLSLFLLFSVICVHLITYMFYKDKIKLSKDIV